MVGLKLMLMALSGRLLVGLAVEESSGRLLADGFLALLEIWGLLMYMAELWGMYSALSLAWQENYPRM